MRICLSHPRTLLHLGFIPTLLLAACGSSSNPPLTTVASAGSSGAAKTQTLSYAEAFPENRVRRLDITISAENWQRMLADMTDMLGAFGASSTRDPGNVALMGGGGAGPTMPPSGMFGQAGSGMTLPQGSTAGAPSMQPFGQAGSGPTFPPGGQAGSTTMGQGSVDLVARTPIYVDCDVTSEDITLHHVGIRFKGNSSLAMPWMQGIYKLPLRLKFDEFETDFPETMNQRYFGFQSLSLSNGQSDQSLLRDKIGTELFARAGIAAPASAFYRVYVDHGAGPTYFGLYTGIELPKDNSFLDRFFGSHSGNLYKPDGVGARLQSYDEATLTKENNETAADYSDVRGLYDALQADRSDAAAWRAGLESQFDVSTFLHWLALNTVAEDWDTYGQMPHNYYLYADPKAAGRLIWIPWDHSYAFSSTNSPLSLGLTEVTAAWPLIRYLLDDKQYDGIYRQFVAQAAAEEYEPQWAVGRFQAAHDLIAPYVTGTDGEFAGYGFVNSAAAFDEALAALQSHVVQRQSDVAAFLGK